MKKIMAPLVGLLMATCASAQQMVWTWKPIARADARSLHGAAVNSDRSGAFIIGETKIKGEFVSNTESGPQGESWYQICWVDGKGKTLLSKRLRTNDDFYTVQRIRGASKWTIGFMGNNSLGVYDGRKLRIYTLKNGKVNERERLIPSETTIAFFQPATFGGWLEQESIKSGSYRSFDPNDGSDYQTPSWDIKSLSVFTP